MKLVIYKNLNELRQLSILNRTFADLKYSVFLVDILTWLLERGYIYNFSKFLDISDKRVAFKLRVYLKYLKTGQGVLNELVILGKPSRDHIFKVSNLKSAQGGVTLLSTKYGLLTAEEARQLNIGGLAIFTLRI